MESKGKWTCIAPIVSTSTTKRLDVDHTESVLCRVGGVGRYSTHSLTQREVSGVQTFFFEVTSIGSSILYNPINDAFVGSALPH